MIEGLATLARFGQAACGCALVGWLLFDGLRAAQDLPRARATTVCRVAASLAAGFLMAGVLALACQSALVTGRDDAAWAWRDWWLVSIDTYYGRVWWLRQALMAGALMLVPFAATRPRLRPGVAVAAALAITAGAAGGHAAALEPAWPALVAQALHLVALGLWWGGLLPLAFALRQPHSAARFVAVLAAFSQRATVAMAVILITGGYLAFVHVAGWPALFGTRYGQLLLCKLVLIGGVLGLAARLRWHWLRNARMEEVSGRAGIRVPVLVFSEWLLAGVVILIATVLSGTPPARHQQVDWPFPFRLAPETAWAQPGNAQWVIAGAVMLGIALMLFYARMAGMARASWMLPGGIACAAAAGFLALPALSVQAFPDTYRSSEVPYHAISIYSGATLFQRHCVSCHGTGGLGDGPLARGLAKPPADLSAPHTADHTAGDLYWWLSHGMPSGAMPGFARELDAEARWDLINYLRTFSNGYQARIIRPQVARAQPWLGAPDFNYVTQHGDSGSLKDLRYRKVALLVFYSWPASGARLDQLAQLRAQGDAPFVLAVPWSAAVAGIPQDIALPVMVQGTDETVATYALLRRTLAQADSGDRGPLPAHMELLIDRYGYLRARWFPQDGGPWTDPAWLRAQIGALEAEPEILPPPDEHIH